MKKYTLGLDIGITSIGFALTAKNESGENYILDMGSRIIPLSIDDKDEFTKGNAISKNQSRTLKRTQRKGYFRYKLRRTNLGNTLKEQGMAPGDLMHISSVSLYGLRNKAVSEKIELEELGRILYHLNQKRGYKSSRSDANLDKKDTEYVAEVKNRHQLLKESGMTIGQYFFLELQKNQYYRIRQQVYPREAYIEEFDAIMREQKKHHPLVITEHLITELRNEIIYFQRKLKSQKGLVSTCEFEGKYRTDKNGKEAFSGPKVAPKSSPLFQVCKIWESINNIALKNKRGERFIIPADKKQELFLYLDDHKILSQAELFKILKLKKEDGWYGNQQLAKGIQGNITKMAIAEHPPDAQLLAFELKTEYMDGDTFLVDRKTGEILDTQPKKVLSADVEQQLLYRLWHTIYSIQNMEECSSALQENFKLTKEKADALAGIDFTRQGFGNKSARAMRKILPYLMGGYDYSEACSYAGYNHSSSFTREEILKKELLQHLPLLKKNSLRQPVVEKILNQLINLVNAIMEKHGRPDEIRIELARELKQSKEERNNAFSSNNKREKENKTIIERIEKEYRQLGVRATRNTIIKWRLFHEINNEESKLNATCIYCGQPFSITDSLRGDSIDVEHIIPRSRLFDDSQSNKTLVHRKCNEDKGDRTAYDFMESKGAEVLNTYIETVDTLYKRNIIRKGKRDKLLMSSAKIPQDFIDRQLRETQYIARKAKEILEDICYNVWSTSGSVTEYLRRTWGWNDVLMNLQLPKYKELGLTEWKEWQTGDGQIHKKEEISGWSKRNDHRHHAIDALVIACTTPSFINRLNKLSAQSTRDEMYAEVKDQSSTFRKKLSLLDKYIILNRPFTTKQVEEAAAGILVSFKAGKRVATRSKHKARGKNLETGVLVPRGALSEESVYGKIKSIEKDKPVKYLFENPDLIFKPYIRELVKQRLAQYNDDYKLALRSLKKEPVYLDEAKSIVLDYGTCYKDEYVIKYPLSAIKVKDVDYIIDHKVKSIVRERLKEFGNNEKEAFKTTLWFNESRQIPINTVRCYTGLSAVEAVKRNEQGEPIGFVKPGNNHHIALYANENGNLQEHVCTFWHAVERKKHNFPSIIEHPDAAWDRVLQNRDDYPESFIEKLPLTGWKFNMSLQQNEMFIMGLGTDEIEKALETNDKPLLSKHLYRVQKLSSKDYVFRHHLETQIDDSDNAKVSGRFMSIRSISAFYKQNPKKVCINIMGEIVPDYRHS